MKTSKTVYQDDYRLKDAASFSSEGGLFVLDIFTDTPGDDPDLNGTDGDDNFNAGAGGNDFIDGGAGFDRLSYEGIASDTKIKFNLNKGKVKVKEKNDGQRGIDFVENIEQFTGHSGKDIMKGSSGDDQLFAGDGDDKLVGRSGSDRLAGQGGDDKVFGGGGADAIFDSEGNDKLIGGKGEDFLFFGAGQDVLKAGRDKDQDTFVLSDGGLADLGQQKVKQFKEKHDVVDFRIDIPLGDTTTIASLAELIEAGFIRQEGRKVVITFGELSEGEIILKGVKLNKLSEANFIFEDKAITGNGGIPGLADNSGDDVYDGDDVFRDIDINGGAGNDVLNGNGGDDKLRGGDGDDILDGGSGDDDLRGGDDDDILDGGSGDDFLKGGLGQDILRGGLGKDNLNGDEGDDILILDADEDFDSIVGFTGEDVILADFDHAGEVDFFRFNRQEDVLLFTAPDDLVLEEVNGNRTAISVNGNRVAETNIALDTFETLLGRSILQVSDTSERIFGTSEDDALTGLVSTENLMFGMTGDDTLTGAELDDVLIGSIGRDTLDGGEGNDNLFGGGGDDTLSGGGGDDVLTGGAGIDIYKGGDGNDTYITIHGGPDTFLFALDLAATFGDDIIHNFNRFQDKIDMTELGIIDQAAFEAQVEISTTAQADGTTDTLLTVRNAGLTDIIGTITFIDTVDISDTNFIFA